MKRRFKEVVELLDYKELLRMKDDLNKGGDSIRILVENKIKEEIRKHNEFCAVCSSKIEPESETRFTLAFGPDEMGKKVSFCAVDCLQYFLSGLKKAKEVNQG
jgi:hypothetical protein